MVVVSLCREVLQFHCINRRNPGHTFTFDSFFVFIDVLECIWSTVTKCALIGVFHLGATVKSHYPCRLGQRCATEEQLI